jgi:hypothetical protein
MNEQFQQKLLNYAPVPPAGTWDSISNALDETMSSSSFPSLLHNFETSPPKDTWNKIEQQLSAPGPKVIPIGERRKTSPLKRYIAAAVVFLIAAASIIFWNREEILPGYELTQNETPQQVPSSPVSTPAPAPSASSVAGSTALQPPVQTEQASLPSRTRIARSSTNETADRSTGNISVRPMMKTSSLLNLGSFFPKKAQPKETAISSMTEEKYMIYSDDEGQAMKVSKKLISFFVCVKEEILCQQEKRQLEQKIASYTTTSDFAGIVELLRILKENQ